MIMMGIKGFENCVTFDDFLQALKTRPLTSDLRAMVHAVTVVVWGKTSMGMIETQIMILLKIEWEQKLSDPLVKIKGTRSFGSIKQMSSRLKQTHFVAPFRCVPCSADNTVWFSDVNRVSSLHQ